MEDQEPFQSASNWCDGRKLSDAGHEPEKDRERSDGGGQPWHVSDLKRGGKQRTDPEGYDRYHQGSGCYDSIADSISKQLVG